MEVKVGLFVMAGIAVLAFLTMTIGDFHIGKKAGYHVFVNLDTAAGLDKNSPVRIAGVRIGKIEEIMLKEGMAKVKLFIPSTTRLPDDSKVFIKSEGLLGEKYIEIKPGSPGNPTIDPEGVIGQGESPVDIDQILSQVNYIARDIKAVSHSLSKVFGGEEGGEPIKAMADNLSELSSNLNRTVKTNSAKFTRIIDNLDKFSRDLPKLTKKSNDTLSNLNRIVAKIEKGEGTLGKLVNDDTLYAELKSTLKSVKKGADGVREQTPITTGAMILGTVLR